ncbi:MAG TPA: hypothetical protein VGO52_24095 [Hyphomonadaceae bacterium]|nr:hypothetical protein [Hyphomonadaceae bacterium]
MFDTFSVLTLQLARLWGIAALVIALGALTAPKRMSAAMADFERSPGLLFIAAIIALGIGLIQVMFHNLWTDPTAIIVSAIGWLAIVKGIVLMAIPEPIMKLAASSANSPSTVRLYGVLILILAIVLLVLGLGGRATVSG